MGGFPEARQQPPQQSGSKSRKNKPHPLRHTGTAESQMKEDTGAHKNPRRLMEQAEQEHLLSKTTAHDQQSRYPSSLTTGNIGSIGDEPIHPYNTRLRGQTVQFADERQQEHNDQTRQSSRSPEREGEKRGGVAWEKVVNRANDVFSVGEEMSIAALSAALVVALVAFVHLLIVQLSQFLFEMQS